MNPTRSFSRQEIRSIDRCAIEKLGVPGVILMENAGRNATDAIEEFLTSVEGRSVGIVAGAGNNGGDGFVIARHLGMRGVKVATFLVAPVDRITGDAEINLRIIQELKHDIRTISSDEIASLSVNLKQFDVIVDAVGGTGIKGQLRGDLAAVVEQINAAGKPVIAIDIPTGLDCDTGSAEGPVVKAAMTITMLARKKGFNAEGAAQYTGEVRVVDIGIPAELVAKIAAGS
ncbi:MAG: NAD(P)H-hydrate epimerase [Planctomycetota bacterium]|jgi:NAD(P)H-hydrate epimerase